MVKNKTFVYWKKEAKRATWNLVSSEKVQDALGKGAMFTTWVEFAAPPRDDEREDVVRLAVKRFGDLPIDVDSEDISIARRTAVNVIDKFIDLGVRESDLRVFISGSKGFHIIVDRRVLGSEAGDPFLPLAYREVVDTLFPRTDEKYKAIDRSLYCMRKGKMFRLPNVKRENGKYKVPITVEELRSCSETDFYNLSSAPRYEGAPLDKPEKPLPNIVLYKEFNHASNVCRDVLFAKVNIPKRAPKVKKGELLPCTKAVLALEDKAGDMTFNEMCFSAIVPSLRASGFEYEEIQGIPELRNFINKFRGSSSYTNPFSRMEHLQSVIERDKTSPCGFSCGSMRKALGGACVQCNGCNVMVKEFFFDAYEDGPEEDTKVVSYETDGLNFDNILDEFILTRIGMREAVVQVCVDSNGKRTVGEPISFQAFHRLTHNLPEVPYTTPQGHLKYLTVGDAWSRSPHRKTCFSGYVFDPTGRKTEEDGYLNTWTGFAYDYDKDFPVEKAADMCKLYRRHVEEVLCHNDRTVIDFVWAWLADLIQNPGGRKPGSAIVLCGGKGVGKSTFTRPFEKILGDKHFLSTANPSHVLGKFNSHLAERLMIVLEEAFWGGDVKAEGGLKTLITEQCMTIERKGFQAENRDTYMRLVLCSNNEWVVPASADERRFLILNIDEEKRPADYFDALYDEIDNGGAVGLYHWLMAYRPDPSIVLSYPPRTGGLSDQILQSSSSVQAWWYDVLCRGYFMTPSRNGAFVDWEDRLSSSFLYDSYLEWCRSSKTQYPKNRYAFGREMFGKKGFCPCGNTTKRVGGRTEKAKMIGSLEEAREAFVEALNLPRTFKFEGLFD